MRPSRFHRAGYDGARLQPDDMLLLPNDIWTNVGINRCLRADVADWMRENDIRWQVHAVPVARFYEGAPVLTETGIWFTRSSKDALLFKMRWS